MAGDSVRQRGGDDGLDGDGIHGHGALLNPAGTDVVEEQGAHLVAADQLIGSVGTAHGDSHALGVVVRG